MIPQALKERTIQCLEDLERRKVIRRSESEWRNPVRSLEKPNDGIRLVCNLMALNDLVEKDPYELRNIREIIQMTQGSRWFTVLDLKEGFYHIEIEEDKGKTVFEVGGYVYEWNGMVMGYKNTLQIMQRTMNKMLRDLISKGTEVYLDDIVIHGKTEQDHDRILRKG